MNLPLPRTVLGWTTVAMAAWLVFMFFAAALTGHSVVAAVGGWACIFAPILITVALVDRVVSDRRGARSVHQQGAAWQQPEQQLPMPQPPMYPQQPAPPADHNPWA